jgi:hypothetical protein
MAKVAGKHSVSVNQHTMKDGWKVVRKQLSVGVPVS